MPSIIQKSFLNISSYRTSCREQSTFITYLTHFVEQRNESVRDKDKTTDPQTERQTELHDETGV